MSDTAILDDDSGLAGKVAIVTGGGAADDGIGNGRAAAMLLARAGTRVMVIDRLPDAAERTVAMIRAEGGTAEALAVDVTDEEQVKHLIESTSSTFGRLDILMANAGGPTVRCPTQELSDAQLHGGLDLRLARRVRIPSSSMAHQVSTSGPYIG